MSIRIFYFSGTGNSLFVAKRLSRSLRGEMASIASAIGETEIRCDDAVIGIVYPCYLAQISGVPPIVEDFIGKLKLRPDAYLFAVCSYGGFGPVNYLPTFVKLRRIADRSSLRLSAQFSIKLPLNNLDYDHIPVPINRNHEKMFGYTENKLSKMAKYVATRRTKRSDLRLDIFAFLAKPLFSLMGGYVVRSLQARVDPEASGETDHRKLMRGSDYSISLSGDCGVCEKICPARNIRMIDSRPTWLHSCEMCFACDEWCPQRAIHHWAKRIGKNYHHPGIELADMLRQAGG